MKPTLIKLLVDVVGLGLRNIFGKPGQERRKARRAKRKARRAERKKP